MAGIFISYRRDDSDVAAGRLADDLAEIYGEAAVFRDVGAIEAGEDFTTALDRALDSCQVLLAVIGSRWAAVTDEHGHRRLEEPGDWVSAEIERALQRRIRVIPILISTSMPRAADIPAALHPLLQRQAIDLSDRHWKRDIHALADVLDRVPGLPRRAASSPAPPQQVIPWRKPLVALAVTALLVAAGWFAWSSARSQAVPFQVVPSQGAPSAVDLSQWVRIRDSGPEGSVAGLAVVLAMEASLARQGRPVTLSARYIYEKAKTLDRFGPAGEGTDMAAALYVAEAFGAPPEDTWPYIAGSRELPKGWTWKRMDEEAARFRARTFRLSGLPQLSEQLALGRTVVAAIQVTGDWTSDETFKTGVISSSTAETIGAHAVVIVGFDPATESIKFANSWGTRWGANGFGRMSTKVAEESKAELWAIDVPSAQ